MKFCNSGINYIRLLFLSAKLFNFENQKCGQILCAYTVYAVYLAVILIWRFSDFSSVRQI